MSDSEDKLAIELLAHKDSVAAALSAAASDRAEARGEAAYWRGRYCKVMASSNDDFDRLIRVNPLPWENEKSGAARSD